MAEPLEHDAAWHDALVKEHEDRILAMLRRRLIAAQAHIAEDLAQKTFLAAWERRADVPDDPAAWLGRAALNHLLNHRRWALVRLRELTAEPFGAEPEAGNSQAPEHVLDVRRALTRLDQADRELLWLAYVDGYSGEEIAYVLQINPAAARQRLARAARRLRKTLGPDYSHTDHGDGEATT